ncbi:MAG: tyrosine-type recombinase/integrase [Planctomycetota bacterium]|nr:tyrosine-type recombinase/integrase [Planctomycetota bacterium]
MFTPHKRRRRKKPVKPYASFPLTPHNNGQWCKKVRGKIHFFGIWEDPQAALANYLRVAADLHAGRQPSPVNLHPEGPTVKDACNHYLNCQFQKMQGGEIRPSSFEDCRQVAECLAKFLGSTRPVSDLTPTDFQQFRLHTSQHGLNGKSRGLGPYAQSRAITIVRSVFKHAYDSDLIDRPVKFGTGFERPPAALKRRVRRAAEMENGKKLFGRAEIRSLIEAADVPLRAMILLGINGGFGNTDCARLPVKAVDFGRAVVEFDRPKTGVERVVPLWPETLDALHKALRQRPKTASDEADRLVFLTAFGQPWVREIVHRSADNSIEKVIAMDAIGHEFTKLLSQLGMKRKGLGFYALRHTFRTWADEVRDQHAIHRIMGHTIPGMSGIYVEEISLDRLRTVTEHVRRKLFPPEDAVSDQPRNAAT